MNVNIAAIPRPHANCIHSDVAAGCSIGEGRGRNGTLMALIDATKPTVRDATRTPSKETGHYAGVSGVACNWANVFRLATETAQPRNRVNPSALQPSLPTPWCTKNSSPGSYLRFTAASRG